MFEIVITGDGSHTLYVSELDEHYHSIHGAIQESDHVFIINGLDYCKADQVCIFETGFGTGLNAFLSAIYSVTHNKKIFYTSIEKYPLSESIINSLNYKEFVEERYAYLFEKIHSCRWDLKQDILPGFTLLKIKGDLLTSSLKGHYDTIFFDAFGPEKQPDMWTDEVLGKISEITAPGGILVTYCVKGSVQRSLKKSGFNISLLPGPPGKRFVLRGIKSEK